MIQELQVSDELKLLPIKLEDAESLFALIEKNRDHLRQWLPWLDFNTCVENSKEFIENSNKQAVEKTGLVMNIEYQQSMCGVIGFNSINTLHRVCEIGYWIDADHEGRGIISQATLALVHFAFNDMDMNKVRISVAEENARSRAIPERLGFKIEGIAREAEWLYDHYVNHVLYAAIKSEWVGHDN